MFIISRASVNTTERGVDIIYTKPYTRIPPFLVGILLGYYFSVNKNWEVNMHPVCDIVL